MTKNISGTNLSIQALKRVEINRVKLHKTNSKTPVADLEEVNPFDSSDEEGTDMDSDLVAHLDLDTEDLDTKL